MIKIHCTKKLFNKLPAQQRDAPSSSLSIGNDAPISGDPMSDWHANLIDLQDHNCLLFVHNVTRFPVFIKSIDHKELTALQWHFEDTFMNTLLKLDAKQEHLNAAAKALSTLQFDTDCERSVQGTLNRMKGDIENMLWHDDLPIEHLSNYKTGAWLAELLCSVRGQKDYFYPYEAMFNLLNNLATTQAETEKPKHTNNVIKLDNFR